VPAGATVDDRGASALTVVHPLAFLPTADGSIIGERPAVPPASYRVVPAVIEAVPEAVDTILRSSDLRAAHVAAIAGTVEGNFHGTHDTATSTLRWRAVREFTEARRGPPCRRQVLTIRPLPQQNAARSTRKNTTGERLAQPPTRSRSRRS
jgi:hypothetical protein